MTRTLFLLLLAAVPAAGAEPRFQVYMDEHLEMLFALEAVRNPPASDDSPRRAETRKRLSYLKDTRAAKLDAALTARLAPRPEKRWLELVQRGLPGLGSELAGAGIPAAELDAWAAALADAAKHPDFRAHLERREAEVAGAAAVMSAPERGGSLIADYEAYTGVPFDGVLRIPASPWELGRPGAEYGTVLRTDTETLAVNFAPMDSLTPAAWPPRRVSLWHELGHVVIDPLGELHDAYVSRYASLFDKMPAGLCRGNWTICFREQLIEAIAMRMSIRAGVAPKLYANWGREKFPQIPELGAELEKYEADRKRNPDIAGYFDRLIAALPPGSPMPAAPPPGESAAAAPAGRPGSSGAHLPSVFAGKFRHKRELAYAALLLDRVIARRDALEWRLKAAALAYQLGDHAKALAHAEKALTFGPKDPAALALKGLALAAAGRVDEGRESMDAARVACESSSKPAPACAMSW